MSDRDHDEPVERRLVASAQARSVPEMAPDPVRISAGLRGLRRRRRLRLVGGCAVLVLAAAVGFSAANRDGDHARIKVSETVAPSWSVENPGPQSAQPTSATVPRMAARPGADFVVSPRALTSGVPGAITGASAVCLEWEPGRCTRPQGFDDVTLTMNGQPGRVAYAETIFGPTRWRRAIQAFSPNVVTTSTLVNGHPTLVAPATDNTGQTVFVQWEDPGGADIIVSGSGALFTPEQLVAVASGLRVASATVPASVAVATVDGSPPRGWYARKTKSYQPGESTYLTTQTIGSPGIRCLGIGVRPDCTTTSKDAPVAFSSPLHPAVAGLAPAGTTRIEGRMPDGKTFTFSPSSSGPNRRFRYYAHWLPNQTVGPVQLTMRDQRGAVVARVTAPAPEE
ncbi:MAG: hypothetical protein JWL73_1150 [Actinomycetia bacterium]|nr:hypothetical protein [Actinomycetes bacterium]